MISSILLILFSVGLLYVGAELLIKGASSLADRFGLSPLFAGLTILAVGTSAPVLISSLRAVSDGQGGAVVASVIVANSLNIGLVLGVTALLWPLKLGGKAEGNVALIMIVAALLSAWVLYDQRVTKWECAVLLTLLFAYCIFLVGMGRTSHEGLSETTERYISKSALVDTVLIGVGLVSLACGASRLTLSSALIASELEMSEPVMGITLALTRFAMPNLATTLVAAFRKQPDMALGNIIGSNIFNVLAIIGAASFAQPLYTPGVAMLDVAVMVTFAAALFPMIRSGGVLDRSEGFCLLVGNAVYLYWLWPK